MVFKQSEGGIPPDSSILDSTVISETSNYKLVVSGSHFEVYNTQLPFVTGKRPFLDKTYREYDRGDEYKMRNYVRSRNHLRRLVNSNFSNQAKFITLTFHDTDKFDIRNPKHCSYEFKKFLIRLRRLFHQVNYICVVEFQDKLGRGAVHFHVICDVGWISAKYLGEMWGNGFVKINLIRDNKTVGGYISKYLHKNAFDPRFKGIRRYYTSRGLSNYQTYYGARVVKIFEMLRNKGELLFSNTYSSTHNGTVWYFDYYLNSS